jgi:membrane associated rhomboid family serine protease
MGPVTKILIAANVAMFALQSVAGDWLVANFALWPLGAYPLSDGSGDVGFHVWQLATSAFLHANLPHIFLNMFALFMFGRDVEIVLGTRAYAALYAAAVLSGSIAQLLVVSWAADASGGIYPTIGASGGVFGVLLAFGMMFPRRRVMLIFPPIPMPAWLFVLSYGAIELASGVFGTREGVAHFAHLGGMLGAFVVLLSVRRRLRYRPPR